MEKNIKYKKGFKNQLANDYEIEIALDLPKFYRTEQKYITLSYNTPNKANLKISKGYAWDGASGPTWDDKKNTRASLVHDALYQLMRFRKLDRNYRKSVDIIFLRICLEDKMCIIRSYYYYFAIRLFARFATSPRNKKKVISAPV